MEINNDQLKRMQAIQIEMADILLDFCKQYDLTIWAGYGTLLGAVRHKGFIPWDDDMDFIMPRVDFDRLRQLTRTCKLPDPMAFDSDRVDVIKVKNCNTTQVAISKINKSTNYGIWVDIWCLDSFPLDGIPSKVYNNIRKNLRIISNATQMAFSNVEGIGSMLFHTYSLLYSGIVGKQCFFKKIESDIKDSSKEGNELYVNILLYSRLKKNTSFELLKKYKKCWFDQTIMLPFEERLFPCPANYDEILTTEYGDYMTPIKGGGVHCTTILDTDRPYNDVIREYMERLPWYKQILKKI